MKNIFMPQDFYQTQKFIESNLNNLG